jgi:hypothetical protein
MDFVVEIANYAKLTPIRNWEALNVKSDIQDISVLDNVVAALKANLAQLAGFGIGASRDQVLVADHLCPDETPRQIGVNDTRRFLCRSSLLDSPGTDLILTDGKKGLQPQ